VPQSYLRYLVQFLAWGSSNCRGTPVRISLREKSQSVCPQAQNGRHEAKAASGRPSVETSPARRRGRWLSSSSRCFWNMLALGLIMPILPKLVEKLCR